MRIGSLALACAGLFVAAVPAAAEEAKPETEAPAEPEAEAPDEPEEELPPHKAGPQIVSLGSGITIDLPAGMILFEQVEARRQLEERGDYADSVLGIMTRPDSDWEIDIEMIDVGYVSDDDADKLDAGELLTSIQEGNREQNKVRAGKGIAPLEVVGWSKTPRYDRTRRVLSWALDLSSDGQRILNEETNVLGRQGYGSAVLIGPADTFEAARVDAARAIAAIRFQKGFRYEDFDPSVDKKSGLGLRELVVGGGAIAVASKLGLFAKILLALKKFFIVIGAAMAGVFRWLFRRKKAAPSPVTDAAEPPAG